MPKGHSALRPAPTTVPAETEISALFDQMIGAWNAGNGEAHGQAFTQHADYVGFDGTVLHGRKEVVRAQQHLFDTALRGSSMVGEITALRLVTPDLAIIHARIDRRSGGSKAPASRQLAIQTLVAVYDRDGWRFTALHESRVRPLSSGSSVFLWFITDWLWRRFGPRH